MTTIFAFAAIMAVIGSMTAIAMMCESTVEAKMKGLWWCMLAIWLVLFAILLTLWAIALK